MQRGQLIRGSGLCTPARCPDQLNQLPCITHLPPHTCARLARRRLVVAAGQGGRTAATQRQLLMRLQCRNGWG